MEKFKQLDEYKYRVIGYTCGLTLSTTDDLEIAIIDAKGCWGFVQFNASLAEILIYKDAPVSPPSIQVKWITIYEAPRAPTKKEIYQKALDEYSASESFRASKNDPADPILQALKLALKDW